MCSAIAYLVGDGVCGIEWEMWGWMQMREAQALASMLPARYNQSLRERERYVPYLAYDTERVSRMTVILTCPG